MRKLIGFFSILSVTAFCFSQEKLEGLKPDLGTAAKGMSTDALGINMMSLLQMLVSLAIVLVLVKLLLPKMLSRFNGNISTDIGSSIKIEESAQFATGRLYVVSVRNRTLLLCANQQGVNCLADLTEQKNIPPEPPAFFEMVDKEKGEKINVSDEESDDESTDTELDGSDAEKNIDKKELKAVLERLQALTG